MAVFVYKLLYEDSIHIIIIQNFFDIKKNTEGGEITMKVMKTVKSKIILGLIILAVLSLIVTLNLSENIISYASSNINENSKLIYDKEYKSVKINEEARGKITDKEIDDIIKDDKENDSEITIQNVVYAND